MQTNQPHLYMEIYIKADDIFKDAVKRNLIFIDLAGVGWGPPSSDICFFQVITLLPDDYPTHWETGLNFYYDSYVQAGGEATYSWDDLRRDYLGSMSSLCISLAIIGKKLE